MSTILFLSLGRWRIDKRAWSVPTEPRSTQSNFAVLEYTATVLWASQGLQSIHDFGLVLQIGQDRYFELNQVPIKQTFTADNHSAYIFPVMRTIVTAQ
jgi:hypothetical protein